MKVAAKIWMDGKLIPFKDAKIHVLTHALHYSTSVFEGIRSYNTPNGTAIFRLSEHVDRLFNSAKLYHMRMRFSKKEICDAIVQTVKIGGIKEVYIRPLAYQGYGSMGLTPTANNVNVLIACWEWNDAVSNAEFSGSKCKISSWIKIDSRCQPMQAKSASNYGNSLLARMEALDNGYNEAIMLNTHGNVAESSVENIFVIKDGMIKTPPTSSGGLSGITRASIVEMMEKNGRTVTECDLDRDDLYAADEVFMTGTAAEVKPITQIDAIKIGNGEMGKETKELQRSFTDVVMGKDKRFLSWLTFI